MFSGTDKNRGGYSGRHHGAWAAHPPTVCVNVVVHALWADVCRISHFESKMMHPLAHAQFSIQTAKRGTHRPAPHVQQHSPISFIISDTVSKNRRGGDWFHPLVAVVAAVCGFGGVNDRAEARNICRASENAGHDIILDHNAA